MSDKRWPSGFWEYVSRSTMKREIASLAFFTWLMFGGFLMLRIPTTQTAPDAALSTWNGLATFMFGLIIGAFGTDWISKQTTIAGPPMNTEIKTTTEVDEGKASSTTSAQQLEPKP
jgi:hypothetical protein